MTRIYREQDKRLVVETVDGIDSATPLEKGTWVSLDQNDASMLTAVSAKTGIPLHFLSTALDEEETARIDNESGSVLIVIDVPTQAKEEGTDEESYTTEPFVIAYNEDYFITIGQPNTHLIDNLLARNVLVEPQKHVRLALLLIYQMSREFIVCLRRIDSHTHDIEKRLHSSMRNKELFELMAINKSLVYFSTSLHADRNVLNRLLKSPSYKKFENDFDLMEDTAVELDQALEMCQIYSDLLSGMMDAFPSIINNNLNIVMKTLAVITIVISIPTLIASFFGMNFKDIPLTDIPGGFWITVVIAFLLAIIGGAILLYLTRNKPNKKN